MGVQWDQWHKMRISINTVCRDYFAHVASCDLPISRYPRRHLIVITLPDITVKLSGAPIRFSPPIEKDENRWSIVAEPAAAGRKISFAYFSVKVTHPDDFPALEEEGCYNKRLAKSQSHCKLHHWHRFKISKYLYLDVEVKKSERNNSDILFTVLRKQHVMRPRFAMSWL